MPDDTEEDVPCARADTQDKKEKDSSSSSDDEKPEKSKWTKRDNEIDELKKIFFEFLMKWQDQSDNKLPY